MFIFAVSVLFLSHEVCCFLAFIDYMLVSYEYLITICMLAMYVC